MAKGQGKGGEGRGVKRTAICAAMATTLAVGAGYSQTPRATLKMPPAAADPAVDDARRGAAGRLLVASRFRERQAVLLDDSIRSARATLLSECLDRAEEGRNLADCRATGEPTPEIAARLAARRPAMLDEIMAASQTIYARRFTASEMDEITRFFQTPVGRKYGEFYPQIIAEVQSRKAAIARRYLIQAARPAAKARP
ncbi:DUF2059 domain-containing protein [Sphingomonas sp. DC1100-1]|uniref:DUF2059 domain-containing protein n=1 Tax=unclassified Sphingomonas TaxID=196159 RepID=UPI003CE6D381